MPHHEVTLKLPSSVGFLEALYQEGPGRDAEVNCRGGAVILHPHPMYGGNMHNKVIFTCQKVCARLGLATLRFNFRGVGASAGAYDDGQGEQRDVLSALAFMTERVHKLPLYLVGFSFGAWLALKIGDQAERVEGLVGIGTPAGWAELDFMAHSDKPKLLIHGTADQYCDPGELERDFGLMAEPKQLYWVENGDHFFTEKLADLERLLTAHFPFITP